MLSPRCRSHIQLICFTNNAHRRNKKTVGLASRAGYNNRVGTNKACFFWRNDESVNWFFDVFYIIRCGILSLMKEQGPGEQPFSSKHFGTKPQSALHCWHYPTWPARRPHSGSSVVSILDRPYYGAGICSRAFSFIISFFWWFMRKHENRSFYMCGMIIRVESWRKHSMTKCFQ